MTFHGPEKFGHDDHDKGAHGHDDHAHGDHGGKPHESPWVVTVPLVLLAIPSLFIGWYTIEPVLFGNYFGSAIQVAHEHDTVAHVGEEFHGSWQFVLHAITHPGPVYLALLGVFLAWLFYVKRPELPGKLASILAPIYKLLSNKYYFDEFNQKVFAAGSVGLGKGFWKFGDTGLIDGFLVNGSARFVGYLSSVVRNIQSGYLYLYAFTMIIGLAALLAWTIW
jgi:NADH-quinone oxidoreductase subunit L